jgi:hypothetical protein
MQHGNGFWHCFNNHVTQYKSARKTGCSVVYIIPMHRLKEMVRVGQGGTGSVLQNSQYCQVSSSVNYCVIYNYKFGSSERIILYIIYKLVRFPPHRSIHTEENGKTGALAGRCAVPCTPVNRQRPSFRSLLRNTHPLPAQGVNTLFHCYGKCHAMLYVSCI